MISPKTTCILGEKHGYRYAESIWLYKMGHPPKRIALVFGSEGNV
jgi:hypothetical protein